MCPVDAEAAARHLRQVEDEAQGDAWVWVWVCGHEGVDRHRSPRVDRCPWCGARLGRRLAPRDRDVRALSALYVLATSDAANAAAGARLLEFRARLVRSQGRTQTKARADLTGHVHGAAATFLASVQRACARDLDRERILAILRALWILLARGTKDPSLADLVRLADATRDEATMSAAVRELAAWVDVHREEIVYAMKTAFDRRVG